ncbi:MAG: phosphate acyltransferase PlsX [Clostridia bacterium]|nr:phosphate acyltransferase PlsX [Clostridia bacterium]
MKIILDAMGGDNAPLAIVKGAVQAARSQDDEIVLVGPKQELTEILESVGTSGLVGKISIFPASQVISNDEAPVKAVKTKTDSSVVVGANIVRDGLGDVLLSAGSTGALLAAGFMVIGRLKGISRPAICSIYPILGKQPSLLADAGANSDCKPANLLDFAFMGSAYMEKVLGRENPTVGLVNIGTESKKGNALAQKSYELLEKSGLNFIGNVEARDIPRGVCDVIVADGFTGNVILKLTEGMGIGTLRYLQSNLEAEGAMKALGSLKKEFDYSEYGGAPILGLAKPVMKMHGSSDEKSVASAIRVAADFARGGVIEKISGVAEK